MQKIKYCSKCVLSEHFPGIKFDENGKCNFCSDQSFTITEKKTIDLAKKKIKKVLKENKNNSNYDAIVCFSGGKDSTYTLMLATKKYKLKVLAFTFDNGFLSPTAFLNIQKTVDSLGVDHLIIKPALPKLKKIFKASAIYDLYNPKRLIRISSICYSCISIINNFALQLALEKKAPFIIAGFTLGQIPANSIIYKNNYQFLKESRAPLLKKLSKYAGKDILEYFTIKESLLKEVKSYPYSINLLCLENISEKKLLSKIFKLGWKAPQDVDGCSSNCKLNTFNNFVHQKSLGYNPYELELSHLIRQKQLTRKEALEKIQNQPEKEIKKITQVLNISKKEINNLAYTYKKQRIKT